MSLVGSVAEIWRYPVKSMGGERLARATLSVRGLHADRMWAVRDLELGAFTTARRWPILLQCSARFEEDPEGRPAGPGEVLEVIVTFPFWNGHPDKCSKCRTPLAANIACATCGGTARTRT